MITNTSDSFNQDRRRFISAERVMPAIVLKTGRAEKVETIPFVFAVMSNLSGTSLAQQPSLDKRTLHTVLDKKSFSELFNEFKPAFHKLVKNRITPGVGQELEVKLHIKSMKGFTAEEIIAQTEILRELQARRNSLVSLRDAVGRDAAKKKALAETGLSPELQGAIEAK